MLWQKAADKDVARTIDVTIRCSAPTYVPHQAQRLGSAAVRAIGGPRAYVRWTWTCFASAGGGTVEEGAANVVVLIVRRRELVVLVVADILSFGSEDVVKNIKVHP